MDDWPTPVQPGGGRSITDAYERRGNSFYHKVTGQKAQLDLSNAVRMWSTPAAADAVGSTGGGQGRSLRTDIHALRNWPTANATDYKGASTRSAGKERPDFDDDLPTRLARHEKGTLNPDFVEALMGMPPGWTCIPDTPDGLPASESPRPRGSRRGSPPREKIASIA